MKSGQHQFTSEKRKLLFLLRVLANGFAVTFPLETFGVLVGGYPVTLAFIAASLLAFGMLALGLLGERIRRVRALFFTAFILWSFVTLIVDCRVGDVVSLVVCIILMLPLLGGATWETIGRNTGKWFVWGAIGSVFLAGYQLLSFIVGVPSLNGILPMASLVREQVVGGIPRASAAFLEPSYYAVYLVFAIGCLDLVGQRAFSPRTRALFRALLSLAMFSTLSVAGLLLVLAYYGTKCAWKIYSVCKTGRVGLAKTGTAVVGVIVLAVGLLLVTRSWRGSASYVREKIAQVGAHLTERERRRYSFDSSVDVRLGAGHIVGEYWSREGPVAIVKGVGFNRCDDYLRANYGWAGESAVAKGSLPNVYGTVLMGTGVVGFALYLGWLFSLVPGKAEDRWETSSRWAYFLTWLLAQATTGQLIVYPTVGYAYLLCWNTRPPSESGRRVAHCQAT